MADRKPMWKAKGRGRKRKEDNREDRKLGGKMRASLGQQGCLIDEESVTKTGKVRI